MRTMRTMMLVLAALLTAGTASAQVTRAQVVTRYADLLLADYNDSIVGAETLKTAIDAFVAAPSVDTLHAARDAWKAGRPAYLQTEMARFYDGPIDNAVDGPEAFINAWPLDESYIDYVVGGAAETCGGDCNGVDGVTINELIQAVGIALGTNELSGCAAVDTSGDGEVSINELIAAVGHALDGCPAGILETGIINEPGLYPTIDTDLLIQLNEGESETTISSGWHAIEFLLWGQDLSATGPGNRPFTDYVTDGSGTARNQERRGQYLKAAADLMVDPAHRGPRCLAPQRADELSRRVPLASIRTRRCAACSPASAR